MYWEGGWWDRGGGRKIYARSMAPIPTAKGGRETEKRKSVITTNTHSSANTAKIVGRWRGEVWRSTVKIENVILLLCYQQLLCPSSTSPYPEHTEQKQNDA